MERSFGFRTLVGICAALAVLLAVLATVQFQWSGRIARADAEREREYLDSAMALFAGESEKLLSEGVVFLQTDARTAIHNHTAVPTPPPVFDELFLVEVGRDGSQSVQWRDASGSLAPTVPPAWMKDIRCGFGAVQEPLAFTIPVFEVMLRQRQQDGARRIEQSFRMGTERCFVARIDLTYFRDHVFPDLVKKAFGESGASRYDVAVRLAGGGKPPDGTMVFGTLDRVDLRRPFLALSAMAFAPPLPRNPRPGANAVFIERMRVSDPSGSAPFFGDGVLELLVAHKDMPLSDVFERARMRNLLLSLGVDVLLLIAIAVLVVGAHRMQQLAERKVQFVAGVSHELRTPVSAIALLSRNQADGLVEGPEKVRQYGELIHQQSRRLNEMVEQTLQFAGVHSGLRRSLRQEVDFNVLVNECLEARRADLSRAGFETEVAIPADLPRFQGDAHLLKTAVDNLLSNVLKYAGSGRWLRVRAEHDANAKEIRIHVEDHGGGVEAADQPELFEPFYRGKAAVEAQIPGSGLGLSLVRSAVDIHRGTVTLESEPGRGSTFTLHLPV